MLIDVYHRIFKLTKLTKVNLITLGVTSDCINSTKIPRRYLTNDPNRWFKNKASKDVDSTDLVILNPKQIFEKEFPEYFSDGKFITRISYVDYVDQALEKMKELGLEKDIEAYKELLRIFPPGKYHPKSRWDIGLFHAPQQLCAVRLLHQMEMNLIRPDKEVEALVVQGFSKSSAVWLKISRMTYWSMKGRNIDPYPLPDKLPKKTRDLAKLALIRMLEDSRSLITVTNTSSLPDVIDQTWIVYSQSPEQKSIISKLNEKSILYIEDGGLTFVGSKYLSYFVMKVYDDEETIKKRAKKLEPDYNYNTLKMMFYGKPIKEKLEEMENIHRVDDNHILAVGITGTSSHDSVLSWLKIMQQRNPNLNKMSVVFRLSRPTMDLQDPSSYPESDQKKQNASN